MEFLDELGEMLDKKAENDKMIMELRRENRDINDSMLKRIVSTRHFELLKVDVEAIKRIRSRR